jgi:hypothetical protein
MGGTVTAVELILELNQKGIRLEAQGDRLRYSSRSAVTTDLAEQMNACKGQLLAILGEDRITLETRRRIRAALIERVNAAFRDGPIDWPQLDDIEQRILTAETMTDLLQAVANFEGVALRPNYAGPFTQYCV